jgi:glycosyltransferase involved in cell wall biosynthesis
MRFAIVIPAFNEARTIRAVAEKALRESPAVIVVDDGSWDGTSEAVAGLPVDIVRHPVNRGKAAALWSGFDIALADGVDYVATVDGDGQHDPADLRRLMAAAHLHPDDIIVGARLLDRGSAPVSRRLANRIADFWISWAAGYPIADSQSGERLYPAGLLRVVEAAHDREASFTFESEVLIRGAQLGYASVAVPIRTVYAGSGRPSHFRPIRDIGRIVFMVARSLLACGLHPAGLWNSLRSPPTIVRARDHAPGTVPDWTGV